MERILKLIKVNLKISILPYFLLSVIVCLVSPLFAGVEALNDRMTANLMEIYISLIGILLFIPIFAPEQNKNTRDVIATKKTAIFSIYVLRFIMTAILALIIVAVYLLYLRGNECAFDFGKMYFGTIANMLFLGGIGLLFYAVTDNIIIGYMIPIFYYVLNYGIGIDKLGKFYLFSMTAGEFGGKYYLFAVGLVCALISLLAKGFENKLK